MKNLISILFLIGFSAYAQSYNPGLPIPGLPKNLGQKTMANSTSVVIASDQSISVTASSPSAGTNGSTAPTSSTQIGGIDQSGNLQAFRIGANGITVSASQSGAPWTATITGGVAITATPTVNQGTSPWVTSVPAGVAITNTPSVSQSGSWTFSIPTGVGITNTPSVNQGTSPWVVTEPNGVGITVTVRVNTSTITRSANSVSNQTLLSSNTSRKGVLLFNDSTTNCYIKFGATASTTSFTVKMFATDTYIMDQPTYTGIIDYLCDAATGNLEVNEE